jgi:hypothetical protein
MVRHHRALVLTLVGWVLWGYSVGLNPASAAPPASETLTLDAFIRLYGRPPEEGGGKPAGVCKIAPSLRGGVFFSDRPTFIWQGSVQRIEVRTVIGRQLVWGKNVAAQEQSAAFPSTLPPLLPNIQYQVIFDGDYNDATSIELISTSQRDLVQSGLNQRTKALTQQRPSKPTLALQKATYLAEQNYKLDAFGLLFSVPLAEIPVAERARWAANLTELRQRLCRSEKR